MYVWFLDSVKCCDGVGERIWKEFVLLCLGVVGKRHKSSSKTRSV
jgi:hypothetical protein